MKTKKGKAASQRAKEKGYPNIATLIDSFPNNVAVVSLKQTIINAINKDQNDKIEVPSYYSSLLLQPKDWDSYKANFDNYQAMLVKNDSKKDDKK